MFVALRQMWRDGLFLLLSIRETGRGPSPRAPKPVRMGYDLPSREWQDPFCPPEQPLHISDLIRGTPGSAGLDLSPASRTVLTPEMGIQALSMGVRGPPPPGTMGLLLGRTNVLLRGIRIHPGLVNSDSEGEIRIMASVERRVAVVPTGD